MLNIAVFTRCLTETLREKGFGEKRIENILFRLHGLRGGFVADGADPHDAVTMALHKIADDMRVESILKSKMAAKTLQVQAQNRQIIEGGLKYDVSILAGDGGNGPGTKFVRAAMSLLDNDPRSGHAKAYPLIKQGYSRRLWAVMGDNLEHVSKGKFGAQKGVAHLPNIVKEAFGEDSGDGVAKEFAKAYEQTQRLGVKLFNDAGGALRALKDFHLPQIQNSAKIIKAGEDTWRADMNKFLDWNKMRWPNGAPIRPVERDGVLGVVYKSFTTDGVLKVPAETFGGQGNAVGNMLDEHRFLVYKDSDSWNAMHNAYGDGNVFDVISHHIELMAHRTALVKVFGPNPEMARQNLTRLVEQEAAKISPAALAEARQGMRNKFDPVFDLVTRSNPMHANSAFGSLVTGMSNILTAAQLGSASLLAAPGDFATSVAVRLFNGYGLNAFGGVGYYMKALALDPEFAEKMAAQAGFVMDETVGGVYSIQRFNGISTWGPSVTRKISDGVMRASLMSGHTKAARYAVQMEFLGMMARDVDKSFDQLGYGGVMQRYGIGNAEWDAFRKGVAVWEPQPGARFMRPLDIYNSNIANKDGLYQRFQGMVYGESRMAVPDSTMEATAVLRGATRPDTLMGLLLHSFSMYKNFPLTFQMQYGRLALSNPNSLSRVGFLAGLGASMVGVGALGVQMRELASGRDPLPMNTPGFWGKAFLSGGAMGIWGDVLFGGVNGQGSNPAEIAGGPFAGLLGDTTQLALGSPFKWVDAIGGLQTKDSGLNFGGRAVAFAKRYTPGSNIWWARKALEGEVWDRLQQLADPRAYNVQRQKIQKQQRSSGNGYWWEPGQTTLIPQGVRAPHFGGH